jgi:ABC-type Fe3+ transport system permease subunit
LLKPAITASLVFSFVRAMTAISAVIFLVSANYDLAVSYILGRLENNDLWISNSIFISFNCSYVIYNYANAINNR